MSKFNTQATQTGRTPNAVNLANGASYAITDSKKEIASVVLASMLNGDKYYESDASRIDRVFNLVENLDDKLFAAKAMVYVRHKGNLRSISHILANALVESARGASYLRRAISKAVNRPDDMTEMAALWFSRHSDKMLPNSMRRAFRELLESNKWDAYQLKKYAGSNKSVKLKDLVLLTHPRDTRKLFRALLSDNLIAPKTIESELASGKSAAQTFEQMLDDGRLGYMAAIKNIRNALQTGLTNEGLDNWCAMVSDPNRVHKSRMLPFRFVDAWMSIKDLNIDHFRLAKVKTAINKALIASAQNLEFVHNNEKIALILDESSSMAGEFTKGLILAAVLYHALPKDQVVVYFFSSDCRKVEFGSKSPLEIIEDNYRAVSSATYFNTPFELMTKTGTKVNKVVIFTDTQLYSGSMQTYYETGIDNFTSYVNAYKRSTGANPKILFWDLRGYGGSTPLELKNDILLASGFSDKLLSVIPKMWKNQNALVEEIEAVEI